MFIEARYLGREVADVASINKEIPGRANIVGKWKRRNKCVGKQNKADSTPEIPPQSVLRVYSLPPWSETPPYFHLLASHVSVLVSSRFDFPLVCWVLMLCVFLFSSLAFPFAFCLLIFLLIRVLALFRCVSSSFLQFSSVFFPHWISWPLYLVLFPLHSLFGRFKSVLERRRRAQPATKSSSSSFCHSSAHASVSVSICSRLNFLLDAAALLMMCMFLFPIRLSSFTSLSRCLFLSLLPSKKDKLNEVGQGGRRNIQEKANRAACSREQRRNTVPLWI